MSDHVTDPATIRDTVRARYAQSAERIAARRQPASTAAQTGCCAPASPTEVGIDAPAATGSSCCGATPIEQAYADGLYGAGLYDSAEAAGAPAAAVEGSLGCGVPTAVADLKPGETVLDLGSGPARTC